MATFLQVGHSHWLNMDQVVRVVRENGRLFAILADGARTKIGEGDYAERQVDIAGGHIVPAAPDELLHRFFLDDRRNLLHQKERIIAWVVDASYPTAITASGPVTFGWDNGVKVLNAIRHPDGRYDDIWNAVFDDEDHVKKELERLDPEAVAS
jgi:hypothetical protein